MRCRVAAPRGPGRYPAIRAYAAFPVSPAFLANPAYPPPGSRGLEDVDSQPSPHCPVRAVHSESCMNVSQW